MYRAWQSARWRMLAATIALWTIASGIMLTLVVASQRQALEAQKRSDWMALARSRRSHIRSLVDLTVKQLQAAAKRDEAELGRLNAPGDITERFRRAIVHPVLDFDRVIYLTPRVRDWGSVAPFPPELLRVWLHDPDELMLLPVEAERPLFYAVIPIVGSGLKRGWVCAQVSASNLEPVLLDTTSLGSTGETYLVGRDGMILTQHRFIAGGPGRAVSDAPVVRAARSGLEQAAARYRSYHGTNVLGMALPLQEFDWTLVAEISVDEIAAPMRRLLAPAILIWLATIVGGAAIVRALWAPVLGRIRTLADLARRVGEGDFSAAPPNWSDEFGSLARRFTEMSRSVGWARSELESERDLLSAVLASADDAIFSTDSDGAIVTWNATAERMFGYPRREAAGMFIAELFPENGSAEALGREGAGPGTPLQLKARRKDGGIFEARVAVARLPRPTTIAFTFTVADLTEKLVLEQKLVASQKLEALGRLAGSVAHDFNNLLTAILGNCELARRSLGPGSSGEAELKEAVLAANRAATLTRQLLAFSKRQAVAPVVMDIGRCLSEMRELLKRVIGARVIVELTMAEKVPWVKLDPGQLEQVILNLAINARDAMPSGGLIRISIDRFSCQEALMRRERIPPGEYARVTVTDTGMGMDEAVQSKLFEPFFSTKGPDHGTGLGLATVYGIVKQGGGFINVTSAPGQGSSFEILLPACREEAGASRGESPEPAEARPAAAGKVLVVEDSEQLRNMFKRWLERAGLRAIAAADGLEALTLLKGAEEPPDIIVTDIVMPRLGGLELAERLRTSGSRTPILFISGYVDGASAELPAGSQILLKPMDETEFVGRVAYMLRSGSAGRSGALR